MNIFRNSLVIDSALCASATSTIQGDGDRWSYHADRHDRGRQFGHCSDSSGQQSLGTVATSQADRTSQHSLTTTQTEGTTGDCPSSVPGITVDTGPTSGAMASSSTSLVVTNLASGTYDIQVQAAATSSNSLVNGFSPTPDQDLVYHGGRTIANLQYANFYISSGNHSWNGAQMAVIDQSLAAAMSDPQLNSVVAQYFPNQAITTQFLGSEYLGTGLTADSNPSEVSKDGLESYITALDQGGFFQGADLSSTVFNFLLPEGTVLTEGDSNSLNGLGGFHGSVHVQNANGQMDTVYYATAVYSVAYADVTNGIPVFANPWENVVGTLYHELNEARTDPDVGDNIRTGNDRYLGWTSAQGDEIGDYPIKAAGQLGDVGYAFGEVSLVNGQGTVPIQYLYSNAVHGAEDPTA